MSRQTGYQTGQPRRQRRKVPAHHAHGWSATTTPSTATP
jgi:hypothetical protein